MTPEQQRIAIAEACGWKCIDTDGTVRCRNYSYIATTGISPLSSLSEQIPNFLSDLNAMREAEKSFPQLSDFYRFTLIEVVGDEQRIHLATAAQRAEAFLRTIGKWEESK